jgi:hypothetical protein
LKRGVSEVLQLRKYRTNNRNIYSGFISILRSFFSYTQTHKVVDLTITFHKPYNFGMITTDTQNKSYNEGLFDHIEKYRQHDTTLLFQRLNYFLLSTSFFLAAFISLINSSKFSLDLQNSYYWIAQILCVVAFVVSLGFTVVNLINARIIYKVLKCLRDLENSKAEYLFKDNKPIFNNFMEKAVKPYKFSYKYLMIIPIYTIAYITQTKLDSNHDNNISIEDVAPHTWLVPILIAFLWLMIYFTLFINHWVLLSLVVLLFIFFGTLFCSMRKPAFVDRLSNIMN